MRESLRQIVGAAPVANDDGTYSPSKDSIRVAVQHTTVYTDVDYPPVTGPQNRVLILCTDESRLECANGKVFKTGNHPTEVFTVVRHLEKAGFGVDFATPSGRPVPVEGFAVPDKDTLTSDAIAAHKHDLDNPLSMADVAAALNVDSAYAAVFVPGGHGALLSVPKSKDAGTILRWFIDQDRYVVTICHGPAGLLSMMVDGSSSDFPLAGYEMVLFPAADDKLMAAIGYLPGQTTWNFEDDLKQLGIRVKNHLPTGSTHLDRKLISGDSPYAADKLGQLVVHTLMGS